MTTAIGKPPISPLDPAVFRDLASERMHNSNSWAYSLELAPEVSTATASGQYISATQLGDVDLQTDPMAITADAMGATEYSRSSYTLGRRTFAAYRYMYESVDMPDREVSELAAQTGFDVESYILRLVETKARKIHRHLVNTTIFTSGNYTNTSDLGNVTSAAFNLFGALETVGTALDDAGVWSQGDPIDVTVGHDVWPYLFLLNQVTGSAENAGGAGFAAVRYGDSAALARVFGTVLGDNVRIRRAQGYYLNTSGTKTRYGSGAIAFTIPWTGSGQAGFCGTVVPAQDNAGILTAREEYLQSMPGRRVYTDGWYGIHIDDAAAGYLGTSLLT